MIQLNRTQMAALVVGRENGSIVQTDAEIEAMLTGLDKKCWLDGIKMLPLMAEARTLCPGATVQIVPLEPEPTAGFTALIVKDEVMVRLVKGIVDMQNKGRSLERQVEVGEGLDNAACMGVTMEANWQRDKAQIARNWVKLQGARTKIAGGVKKYGGVRNLVDYLKAQGEDIFAWARSAEDEMDSLFNDAEWAA